jgi:putative Ca2+/H+ antiporter (TMEM165/GDT1 family)
MTSELRLVLTTFASVFVAELGDKTQLATMALSGEAQSLRARLFVFAGAATALISTSALGVLAGAAMSRFISPAVMQRGAGVLFVILGGLMLWRAP